VLLLKDDAPTAESIVTMLRSVGYLCDVTDLGVDGLEIGSVYDYDVLLLDLAWNSKEIAEVLRRLHVAQVPTPVLILKAHNEILQTLGIEIDNCLAKPITGRELATRVESIVDRGKVNAGLVIMTGMLMVDLGRHVVEVGGRPMRLTSRERRILEVLAAHKGTKVTKEFLLKHLYGGANEPDIKVIDVFICNLRRKLALASGQGYALRDPSPDESGDDRESIPKISA
jgi:two-component system cell cycle response regulator CtrA